MNDVTKGGRSSPAGRCLGGDGVLRAPGRRRVGVRTAARLQRRGTLRTGLHRALDKGRVKKFHYLCVGDTDTRGMNIRLY